MTADHTPERPSAEERQVETLAETLRGWPDEIALARHILRSEWLAGYTAAHLADAEARLAAVETLADEWSRDNGPITQRHSRELSAALHPALDGPA